MFIKETYAKGKLVLFPGKKLNVYIFISLEYIIRDNLCAEINKVLINDMI